MAFDIGQILLLQTLMKGKSKRKSIVPDEAREALGELVQDATHVYTSSKRLAEVGQSLALQGAVLKTVIGNYGPIMSAMRVVPGFGGGGGDDDGGGGEG